MAKILLADDDKHLAKVLARALGAEGHAVSMALDGRTALELARAEAPDLVILDVALPYLSGDEVARQLRASIANARTPILFVSGRDGDRLAGSQDLLAPCAFLAKPIDLDELLATVCQMLG